MNVQITKTESVLNRTQLAYDKFMKIASRWLTTDELNLIQKSHTQQCKNTDAAILYLLHSEYGFTGEQCLEFYNKFRERYGYLDGDTAAYIEGISEIESLKNIGVDITALYGG